MGGEARDLSPELQAKCAFIVKIPTRFCINVGLAGALVMYDRTLSMGSWRRGLLLLGGQPRRTDKTSCC